MRVTKDQMRRSCRKLIKRAEVAKIDIEIRPRKTSANRISQCRPSGKYYISLIQFVGEGVWQDGGGI